MAKYVQNENEVEHYYDSHSTTEDLMGETSFHANLVHYLLDVLRWMFSGQRYAIYADLNFYQTLNFHEYPVAPDVAVIQGVEDRDLRSWTVGRTGPAPQVVFEIASKETWKIDLKKKPFKYAQMEIHEYFLYDPETPLNLDYEGRRLLGWRLDETTGTMRELMLDAQGRLWSSSLDSFLVPDGKFLRLYDRNYQRRLTEAEAHRQQEQAAQQKARLLEEKLRALGVNPEEL